MESIHKSIKQWCAEKWPENDQNPQNRANSREHRPLYIIKDGVNRNPEVATSMLLYGANNLTESPVNSLKK